MRNAPTKYIQRESVNERQTNTSAQRMTAPERHARASKRVMSLPMKAMNTKHEAAMMEA